MVTIKCKYVEKNKITTEITVSDILGTFTGITVKERFINENVSFCGCCKFCNSHIYIFSIAHISLYFFNANKPNAVTIEPRTYPSPNILISPFLLKP